MILVDVLITISLIFILYRSSIRNRIRTEVFFTKILKSYFRLTIVFIACTLLMIATIVWEFLNNGGIEAFRFMRLLIFSQWLFIPYKLVVAKDGFYNVTRFGGSVLICTLEQFQNFSHNKKGKLIIGYLNNNNQITSIRINENLTNEDIKYLKQLMKKQNESK